jgi:transcriptional antiterminator RfaH
MDRVMHWLLAYTKPRQERVAEEHLRRQGYDVLCPQLRVQKLRRRRWTLLEEPLFPRYLFVGATDEQSWAPVRSTAGVASLVRFGGQVAEVPLELIKGLRNAAEEPQAVRPLFKQGQKVRIVTGDFATLEGVFDMAGGDERATVLLDLLGRQSPVRVGVGEIVNAD